MRRRLGIPLVVWSVFGLLCAASALWGMRTHGHSPVRVVVYELLVWNAWAPATLVVVALGRRWPLLPLSARTTALHCAAALVFGIAHHVWWSLMQVTVRPFDAMGAQTLAPLLGEVADRLFLEGTIYFAVLGVSYGVRTMQLEASLTRAQLTALELQLQPHFLFNTLHTVAGLVRENRRDEAVAMIANLSDLLRYSLDHAGTDVTSLRDELAIVRRYLAIQQLRFSDRLGITFDIAETTDEARFPVLLLQPLVENAIRHGAERVASNVEIALRTRRERDMLVIELENTAQAAVNRDGIGFANTRARLSQLYGERHRFEFRLDAGRAVTTLHVPWQLCAR